MLREVRLFMRGYRAEHRAVGHRGGFVSSEPRKKKAEFTRNSASRGDGCTGRVRSRQLPISAGLAAFTDRVLMSKLLTMFPEPSELPLPPLVKTLKIVGFWYRL